MYDCFCLGLSNQKMRAKFPCKPVSSLLGTVEKTQAIEAVQNSIRDLRSLRNPTGFADCGFLRRLVCPADASALRDSALSTKIGSAALTADVGKSLEDSYDEFGRTKLAPFHCEKVSHDVPATVVVDGPVPWCPAGAGTESYSYAASGDWNCQMYDCFCLGLSNQKMRAKFPCKPVSSLLGTVEKTQAIEAVQNSIRDLRSLRNPTGFADCGFLRRLVCPADASALRDRH
ncbi:hypothetical protein AHF37_04934 [Paragonimus kellicotti]|nr:hypothetical protein AHF37_04934 [Paragonimus kellicotti]